MIEHLRPQDLNCNVFSIDDYDYEDMTIQELLNTFFTKINECISTSNNALDFVKWVKEVGLSDKVTEILNSWLAGGQLGTLITTEVLTDIAKNKQGIADNSKLINATRDALKTELGKVIETLREDIDRNKSDISTNDQHIHENITAINHANTNIANNKKEIDTINIRLKGLKKEMVDFLYPVGIYIDFGVDKDPNVLFEGTRWEEVKGVVRVGLDDHIDEFSPLNKRSGEITHVLSVEELASHKHHNLVWGNGTKVTLGQQSGSTQANYNIAYNQGIYDNAGEIGTGFSGNNKGHNNLQPYVVCKMWKRIV